MLLQLIKMQLGISLAEIVHLIRIWKQYVRSGLAAERLLRAAIALLRRRVESHFVGISPLYRRYVVGICERTFDLNERSCTQVSDIQG